jgi:hypothetical protein
LPASLVPPSDSPPHAGDRGNARSFPEPRADFLQKRQLAGITQAVEHAAPDRDALTDVRDCVNGALDLGSFLRGNEFNLETTVRQ